MKLILSRKSFDSAYGGKSNLILPNGTFLTIPIPGHRYVSRINFNEEKYNPTEYRDIKVPKIVQKLLEENKVKGINNYADLMLNLFNNNKGKYIVKLKEGLKHSLSNNRNRRPYYCHLDPDLIYDNLERKEGWRGLFGPSPSYQKI